MKSIERKYKEFWDTPNPDSKFGGYEDWLNDLKTKNKTLYEEYMEKFKEMEKRKEKAKEMERNATNTTNTTNGTNETKTEKES